MFEGIKSAMHFCNGYSMLPSNVLFCDYPIFEEKKSIVLIPSIFLFIILCFFTYKVVIFIFLLRTSNQEKYFHFFCTLCSSSGRLLRFSALLTKYTSCGLVTLKLSFFLILNWNFFFLPIYILFFSCQVWFMTEHSHIFLHFDEVSSAFSISYDYVLPLEFSHQ